LKVLVLGYTGLIGAAVIDALLPRQHELVALARAASAAEALDAAGGGGSD
jgi:uncharacterized protein YbjT (DUF2867 family)